ncbi:MAG: divergent PAP2 family protein, partial [Oscillospiraceae bacterium]
MIYKMRHNFYMGGVGADNMYGLSVLTSNYLINVAFVSWASAQILKTIFTFVFTKKFVAERLFGAGGMPSAHSALVCSLAVA